MMRRRPQRLLPLSLLLGAACPWAPAGCDGGGLTAPELCELGQGPCDVPGAAGGPAEEEEELLRVSLLQGGLSVRRYSPPAEPLPAGADAGHAPLLPLQGRITVGAAGAEAPALSAEELLPLLGRPEAALLLQRGRDADRGRLDGVDTLQAPQRPPTTAGAAWSVARTVLMGYGTFYGFCIACIWWGLIAALKRGQRKVQYCGLKRVVMDIDVEEETWRSSFFDWVVVSWATNWVGRWGASFDTAQTKIKADDLPQMGNREYQARESGRLFQKLWADEVARNGLEKAKVFNVLLRLWGLPSMVALMACASFQYVFVHMFYITVVINKALDYYTWLQHHHRAHPDIQVDLGVPLTLAICAFNGPALCMILLHSFSQSVARRLDQRTTGALTVAAFEKAQRLPSRCLQAPEAKEKDGADKPVRDADDAETAGADQSPTVDLMQLIGFDIGSNLQGAYQQVCTLLTNIVAVVVFTAMLWMRLRRAALCALGVALPTIFVIAAFSNRIGGHYNSYSQVADARIKSIRELLTGIRIVKSYAWEESMEAAIAQLRRKELAILGDYMFNLGVVHGVGLAFPRLLIIAALAGFAMMYGSNSVTNIFVSLQLLWNLRGAFEGVFVPLAKVIYIQPSLQRFEAFLKMAEAPVLPPEKVPDWLELWPKPVPGVPLVPCSLSIRGSFSFVEGGAPALRDLRLDIPRGELVAVLGRVGSGKSTLLQALLGELYPDQAESCQLCRPELVAFCSQVPHIAEGTLKDNVLFGQEFDQARYSEAVAAAALEADLKVLPGGDLVPIGSRGITLSGGQKARVALARAAYHRTTEVVLMDDPFASVDAPTGQALLERLLLGPLMQGRTRVVVVQPDADRLARFDRVLIFEDGCVKEEGPPAKVLQTEAYKKILSSRQQSVQEGVEAQGSIGKVPANSIERIKEDNRGMRIKLREEDLEGRPTMSMVRKYIGIGRWRNLCATIVLFFAQTTVWLFCDLVMVNWANAMSFQKDVNDLQYISAYLFWLALGLCLWVFVWAFGMAFSLRISGKVLGMTLARILRAPIDKFFDKHPIGRIMNRMVSDIASVDFQLFLRTTGVISIAWQMVLPLGYVHSVLPWCMSLLAMPLYWMVLTLVVKYWHTTVPLKFCATNSRSEMNSIIADGSNSCSMIRAYGEQERITQDMCDAVDNYLKAFLYSQMVLRRWLVARLVLLWNFYITSMYLVALLNPCRIGAGTLGLCLALLNLPLEQVEPYLDHCSGAQTELIALARLNEYLDIPQEKPMWLEQDTRYRSFSVRLLRSQLGRLQVRGEAGSLEVWRPSSASALLRAGPCGTSLVAAGPAAPTLAALCPTSEELQMAEVGHRLAAVNDAVRDLESMVRELCEGSSEEVLLEVQSDWLADGARVELESVRAGYADIPRDVIKGISLTVEPRTKVGIVGTTGCGKSSLLLVLLRVLEPRAGRILLNGVDICEIGLGTLRRSLGLVPQDPVLFSGTLRENLDPLGEYSEGRVQRAVELAQLTALVASLPKGIHHPISDEGSNISFGQRQLVCLARMVLRHPSLLLLDEATSAIDPRTQELVQSTLFSAFTSSTVLAVAHRLETVLDFDQVCVMDRGEIVEQGPVKEVAQLKGGHLNAMLAAKRVALQ